MTNTTKKLAKKKGVVVSEDRKSTRLNSSHMSISYAVFCLKKKITGISSRYECRIKVKYHKDIMGLIEEGMLVAVRNFRSNPKDQRHSLMVISLFFFNDTATTEIYTLSLHDALPI